MNTVPVGRAVAASAALVLLTCGASTKSTSNWIAPDFKPAEYQKVMVLARISEDSSKRLLEDAVVRALKERSVTAITAYQNLAAGDLVDAASIRAKATGLGVDAGIVYTVTGGGTQVESGPHVSVGIGVPVNVGMFSAFIGTSVPLGGGTKTTQRVEMKAEFYHREGQGPQWIGTYSGDLGKGPGDLADDLARLTVKQLRKAGIVK